MGKIILFIVAVTCWVFYIHHNGEVIEQNANKDIVNGVADAVRNNVETESHVTSVRQENSKSEYVRLVGRGYSDSATGEEPKYVGLTGFVVVDNNKELLYDDKQFPTPPWHIHTVKQVGPNQFQDTSITVPHKTKVKVLKQILWDEGNAIYSGALLVEDVQTNQQFFINVENFMTYPYWEDDIKSAAKEGLFIAVYNGKGKTPLSDGKFVELKPGTEVVIDGDDGDGYDGVTNTVTAKVYMDWQLGYGGGDTFFDPSSLDIKY